MSWNAYSDFGFPKRIITSYGKSIRFVDPNSTKSEEQCSYSFDAYYIGA